MEFVVGVRVGSDDHRDPPSRIAGISSVAGLSRQTVWSLGATPALSQLFITTTTVTANRYAANTSYQCRSATRRPAAAS